MAGGTHIPTLSGWPAPNGGRCARLCDIPEGQLTRSKHAGSGHRRYGVHRHGAGSSPLECGPPSRGAGLQGRPPVRHAPRRGRRGGARVGHRSCGGAAQHAGRGVRVPPRRRVPRAQRAQLVLRRRERERHPDRARGGPPRRRVEVRVLQHLRRSRKRGPSSGQRGCPDSARRLLPADQVRGGAAGQAARGRQDGDGDPAARGHLRPG